METNLDLVEGFAHEIAAFLGSFPNTTRANRQSFEELLNSEPGAFSKAAVSALSKADDSAGIRYLMLLLRKQNLLERALSDPEITPRKEALATARAVASISSPIAPQLERMLSVALDRPPSPPTTRHILRILELLQAAPQLSRIGLMRTELLAYSDSHVRSKAMLLLGRASKSMAWLGRALLDEDPRVRASTVEAMCSLDPADGQPLLIAALKSRYSRVAANAAVGLYRIGDSSAIGALFEMSQREDSKFRVSAIWAMGEVLDPRFLPFLTERFQHCTGLERSNLLRSMTRIRQREASLADAEPIEIQVIQAGIQPDESRRLVCALWTREVADLSAIAATDFALWEGGAPVYHYSVSPIPNPLVVVSGFVVPRFLETADPYPLAITNAMVRCMRRKRTVDLWRIDRYLPDRREPSPPATSEQESFPYDPAVAGTNKALRGFLTAPDVLRKVVSSLGPKDRAAMGVLTAFERQSEAILKFSGIRQMFVFVHVGSDPELSFERRLKQMIETAKEDRITLHGFAPDTAIDCAILRDLCLSSSGGSFTMAAVEELPAIVEKLYARLNQFEITYQSPVGSRAGTQGSAAVFSQFGCGRTNFSLR